jgi:hypothetical protein
LEVLTQGAGHLVGKSLEERGGQVTLAEVRNNDHDLFA